MVGLDVIKFIVITVTIFAGLPVLVMWGADRFIGTRTAIAIGFLTTAFILYEIVSVYKICRAEPICFPPEPGSDSIGTCTFPCDAPGGILDHAFILLAGPISVALLLAATLFTCLKFRRKRYL